MAVRHSQELKKTPSFTPLHAADGRSPVDDRSGSPEDDAIAGDFDPVVMDASRALSAASDFDVQRAFQALQMGDFDPADANSVACTLFPDLDGRALQVAADRLWRHAQDHAHESGLVLFHQALAHFLSPDRVESDHGEGVPPVTQGQVHEPPVSPEAALQRCIGQLASGKYTDTHQMVSQAFSGITGRALLEQLRLLEQHVKGSETLDEIERDAVLNVIRRLREADPSSGRRKLQLPGIGSRGPVQDLGHQVVQEMHRSGKDARAINAFLNGLSANALMETLGRLLDPDSGADAALVQLARDRLRLVEMRERALVLAPLIDWHEGGCQGDPPPLPIPDDAPASLTLLRQLVLMAEQEIKPEAAKRLHGAFDAYRAAVDVLTARAHGDERWIREVRVAMKDHGSPEGVLAALLKRCGAKVAVAVALHAAVQNAGAWNGEEWTRLRRIVAEWYAIEGMPPELMANPGKAAETPTKLKVVAERLPKRKAGPGAREHYDARQKAVAAQQRMAFNDAKMVRDLLSHQLHLRQPDPAGGYGYVDTSDEDLCVQLLAVSPIARDRLLLALAIVAHDPRVKEQPLAQRLMNKMDEAVPSIMQVKPLSPREKFKTGLSVFANGVREGAAHWAGAGLMRTTVHYAGPWGTIVLTFVSVGVLPLLASRYLHSLETPDYRMHPRKVVHVLLDLMPGLGAAAGIGFSLYVGVRYGAFSEEGVHVVLIALAAGNLGRFLIREPVQSWTRSSLTRGIALTDRQGNPPSMDFQYRFNVVRDLAYTVPYIAASVCTLDLVKDLANELFPVLDGLASVLGHSFVVTFPGALVEAWDGMLVDAFLALSAALIADYVARRGTQPNPGRDWTYWMRHGLARTVAMCPSDTLAAIAAALMRAGYRPAALVLAALAGATGGPFGALRGRTFNFVMTTVSTVQNGSVLPDGLVTFVGRGAMFLGHGLAQAAGSLVSLVDGGTAGLRTGDSNREGVSESETVSIGVSDSDSDSDSDEEYFDPENDPV